LGSSGSRFERRKAAAIARKVRRPNPAWRDFLQLGARFGFGCAVVLAALALLAAGISLFTYVSGPHVPRPHDPTRPSDAMDMDMGGAHGAP